MLHHAVRIWKRYYRCAAPVAQCTGRAVGGKYEPRTRVGGWWADLVMRPVSGCGADAVSDLSGRQRGRRRVSESSTQPRDAL
eukprot:3223222-Pleurochrysis_carterae.AAC.4